MIRKLIKEEQKEAVPPYYKTPIYLPVNNHVVLPKVWYNQAREKQKKHGVQLTATILGGREQTVWEENVTERKPD